MGIREKVATFLIGLSLTGCHVSEEGANPANAYLSDAKSIDALYGSQKPNSKSIIEGVNNPPKFVCHDSDGQNYLLKGKVYGWDLQGNFEVHDSCLYRYILPKEPSGDESLIFQEVTVCRGNTCRMVEYNCDEKNKRYSQVVHCPNGCAYGQCHHFEQNEMCKKIPEGIRVKRNGQTIDLIDACYRAPLSGDKLYATNVPAVIVRNKCHDGKETTNLEYCVKGCEDISCK